MRFGLITVLALAAKLAAAMDFTYVPIPGNANIQTDLMSTFPTGTFTANNTLATQFSISSAAGNCGASNSSSCNYYHFALNQSGSSLTIDTSVSSPTDVYTIMNAYNPAQGQQLGTITFTGSGGASATFPLTGGADIRDVHQSTFADTLANGVSGVNAVNAFTCTVPTTCTDDSGLGPAGQYFLDEQHFSLGSAFAGQTLTKVVITDTFNASVPFIVGLTIGSPGLPSISAGGVVPVFSSSNTIQTGSWVSIFGTNLASGTATWNGDFPQSLGGTSVTVDSRPAYLWYVSPTQINLQVPDDSATGVVNVEVTTGAGSATSTAILGAYAPSFSLFSSKYPAAIVATAGSPGNSGSGYDLIGPPGAFSFPSRPVKVGETLILYGVGFGPTSPTVKPGMPFSGAAPSVTNPQVSIGGMPAVVQFAGLVEAGLFQLNVMVPNVATGDQVLQASAGGMMTQAGVFITIQ